MPRSKRPVPNMIRLRSIFSLRVVTGEPCATRKAVNGTALRLDSVGNEHANSDSAAALENGIALWPQRRNVEVSEETGRRQYRSTNKTERPRQRGNAFGITKFNGAGGLVLLASSGNVTDSTTLMVTEYSLPPCG